MIKIDIPHLGGEIETYFFATEQEFINDMKEALENASNIDVEEYEHMNLEKAINLARYEFGFDVYIDDIKIIGE